MPVVISEELVLSAVSVQLNTPVFLWRSYVTPSLIEAGLVNTPTTDPTDPDFPEANMAGATTETRWQVETAFLMDDLFVRIDLDGLREVDSLGIAQHNLGTNQRIVQVFGATVEDSNGDPIYFEIVEQHIFANDEPLLFEFVGANYISLKLVLTSAYQDTEPTYISVVYAGKLLRCERGTHTDHVPINDGRKTQNAINMSESGRFLGKIVLASKVETTFGLKFLRSTWFRDEMRPFLLAAETTPFFFAWKPQEFPNDIGYCWLTENPRPSVHFDTGRIELTLAMSGIAGPPT